MAQLIFPDQKVGCKLFQEGAIALAKVEANGICVDERHLKKAISDTKKKIKMLIQDLVKQPLMKQWKKRYGSASNINSRKQLGTVLVEFIGADLPCTKSGQWQTDEGALATIDHPFVDKYLRILKLRKVISTYLEGIQKEVCRGKLHPNFHLHTVSTYRSSSSKPNFQNFPKVSNDPEIGRLVRQSFVPREGRVLIETDYSGIEVRIAACYHKDPNMLSYLNDKTKDMHRDMAAQCYCLPRKEVTDQLRYFAKNKFVFPQFYGDWYLACAKNMWNAAIVGKELTTKGIAVRRYLKRAGITSLGSLSYDAPVDPESFVGHIKAVEEDFWNIRFPVYGQWKEDWIADYEQRGWARTLTGFVIQGDLKRTEIINYPVQGSAFHCLLWSLNQLVLRELKRAKMKSLIVGQIHDSVVGDVVIEEIEDYKALLREVMVTKLQKEFPWIIVPMEVDFEQYSNTWAEKDE